MGNREYQVWDTKGKEEVSWMQFRRFATSYRKAFHTCINKEVQDSSSGLNFDDEDILPALHLFHHYIELSLKALLEKSGKKFNGHDLNHLLIEVEREYPDFKLTKLSRKLITDKDLVNNERPLLDFQGFRYPVDKDRNSLWVKDNELGSFIMLGGVYNSSNVLISEIEEFFKKEIFKLES